MSQIDVENAVMSDKANALLAQYNAGGIDAVLLGSFAQQQHITAEPAAEVPYKEVVYANAGKSKELQKTLSQPIWF